MATLINPKIVHPPQPINLDAYIYKMQLELAPLSWLEKIFGRAWQMYEKHGSMGEIEGIQRGYAYPGTYTGKGEYFNCFPNDSLRNGGHCFFAPRDSAQPATAAGANETYEPNQFNEWRQPLSVVFWYNQKTFSSVDYPLAENLLAEARAILRKIPFFQITDVYYNPENVFDGYSMDYVSSQYLSFPYGGFRIAGMIQFLEADTPDECAPFVFPNT